MEPGNNSLLLGIITFSQLESVNFPCVIYKQTPPTLQLFKLTPTTLGLFLLAKIKDDE